MSCDFLLDDVTAMLAI
uniref:Uncharacterized protein n=1 Tax=Arundo donax TaxID=35708 RepID=A0A0A8YEW4_ARUDO